MKLSMKLRLAVWLLAIFSNFLGNEWCYADYSPVVLAEYQAWFEPPPAYPENPKHIPVYNSQDTTVIDKQIDKAQAMGITGFVVDWYGPETGALSNDHDRKFIDDTTAELITRAELKGFKIALLYDEGAIDKNNSGLTEAQYMSQLQADLNYAEKYFSSPAYLQINDHPALFVFPYNEVDSFIDWEAVRSGLGMQVTLIDKNPDPTTTDYETFDGFYAWVQPTQWDHWDVRGKDWGKGYLNWFYSTMGDGNYVNKIMVGGVWPGFDDSLAFWGENRFISRRNGQVYRKTMALAEQNNAPYILIATWNDFEEGTDIEFGVDMTLDMEDGENFYQDILIRSSPLKVKWDPSRGELALQVYKDGNLIFDQQRQPGSPVTLPPGEEYAVKLWISGSPTDAIIKKVMIRSQDPKKKRSHWHY